VIQEAAVPEKPVRPRKSLNLLISIFIGGVSGIGLALFSEGISQSFTTPESAERRLALPVLTVISYKKE
jgi:capsular polysaccharide biosynthesis protein